MHPRNRLFVTLGLIYGLLGGLLALVGLADPALLPGDVARAHAHLMLLGLVLMNLYGIGLHVLPRFAGYALRSEHLAWAQFWLANAGLALLAPGMALGVRALALAGGMLPWISLALFALRLWPVLWPRPSSLRAAHG
ncbi:MAG TPA: hypothetical protein VNF69_09230 [Burkholderiales bacterium]|nr:hypothetical protein [Burkholderiales bacterium]